MRFTMSPEVSLVIAAAADGQTGTPALFSAKGCPDGSRPIGFQLVQGKAMEDGSVWLRYRVKNQEG